MRAIRLVVTLGLCVAPVSAIDAQAVAGFSMTLRAMPSGRATTEVALAPPRQAMPTMGTAGTSAGTPAAGTPAATPATPAAPLVIRIDYGQPHLRGRAINTDTLVPFDQPWRTGANAATTLTTSVDLTVGGQALAKGTYILWTLPTRTGWTLIVQRPVNPGAAVQQTVPYDKVRDVARLPLRTQALATPMESFTIWLVPSTTDGAARGELRMAWGTTMLTTDWQVR